MIDGKALWAPDFGQPCDCIQYEDYEDDCPHFGHVEILRLELDDGTEWITPGWHPAVMLRRDQVEIVGDWSEWTTFGSVRGHEVLRRLAVAVPFPVASDALFQRCWLEPVLADGCRVLPTDHPIPTTPREVIHAIMRGEDLIGWICPANRRKVVEADVYMRIPQLGDTS